MVNKVKVDVDYTKAFVEECREKFKELASIKRMQDELSAREKELKDEVEKSMDAYNLKSFDGEGVVVSKVCSSQTISIDTKKLKETESELYDRLMQEYSKISIRKGYLSFKVKA